MAELVPDIIEQILVRSDVRDLIRCKSVCKSWKSLVSDPHFIKTHLNHNYNKSCNNHDIGHRRVTIYLLPDGFMYPKDMSSYLVGSANGLVCICNWNAEFIVANPCTREMKKVTEIPEFSYCFGFGYDKYTDDYKIVAGFRKGEDQACFQVFSLKSNVWKVIGDVKYKFCSRSGILCNGALHWVMYHKEKAVILSFDLSQEDFKEIPQPKDTFYQSLAISNRLMSLGIVEECLCIYPIILIPNKIWMMKNYNVKDSWGIMGGSQECELNRDVLRFFKQLKNGVPYDRSSDSDILQYNTYMFIGAPIFMQSLISPHACHRDTRS